MKEAGRGRGCRHVDPVTLLLDGVANQALVAVIPCGDMLLCRSIVEDMIRKSLTASPKFPQSKGLFRPPAEEQRPIRSAEAERI
jgi:hypothetical protein